MKLLQEYFKLQQQIYNYFGYKEDWVTIPLEDHTDDHWMIVGKEDDGQVVYSPEPFTLDAIQAGEKIYGGPIYTQRFLPKWVYRGEEYTMISVDTQTDGNKFLTVFSNKLECTQQEMKDEYHMTWQLPFLQEITAPAIAEGE